MDPEPMDPEAMLLAMLDAASREDGPASAALRVLAAEPPAVEGLGDDPAAAARVAAARDAFVRARVKAPPAANPEGEADE